MAGRYSIETVYKLIDNITAPLDKIGVKGSKVGKVLKRDFIAAQDTLDNFGKKLKTIGGYALAVGVGAVGVGIGIATKQFIEFDSAATAATAKFKDLDVTSETYAESLKKVGQVARDVAAVTEYNAVDTAGALDKMAMAGLTSEQSMKLLMGTTNLATAAGMDLTTAVDIATDSLGAFALLSEDASQLQTNLDRVSDVMAKTTNMFNTDMPGMFESIKKGGPAFTAAGQSIETFSSLIGVMASSGVKGSEAGTQLRNMMLSLANPAEKAEKELKRLGIVTKDSQGNYLDIINIIGQFETATKNMGSAEKAAALSTIFGSRAVTGMNILLQEGSAKLQDYRTQLEHAGGAAANIAEAMRGSIKNKIEVLKSALMELGFRFVEVFQEKGVGLIEELTDAIANFDPQPIIDGLVTAGNTIAGIIKIVWNLRHFILGAAAAWGIYKTAMIGAVIVSKIMGLVKAVQTLMMIQKGMNVVQAVFNVLLMANPVGLVIVAIAILIGLIALAVTHWKKIVAVLQYAWEWIKYVALVIWDGLVSAFSALTGFISENSEKVMAFISIFTGPFGFVISMVYELIDSWDMVVNTFKTDGIIAGLQRLAGVLISGLLAPVQGFLELLSKIPIIGDKIAPAASKIADFRAELKGYENDAAAQAASGVAAASRATATPRPARQAPGKFKMPNRNTESPVEAASPPAAVVPPAITNPVPEFPVAPGVPSMRQPALLNLHEGRLFRAGPVLQSPAAGAASLWNVPVEPDLAKVPAPITQAAPVPRIVPPAVDALSVPVKYDFPELIVPPELIKPVSVQVQWVFPPPPDTPDISTITNIGPGRGITRTVSAISRGGSRRCFYSPPPETTAPVPAPLAQAAPPAGRIVPPAMEAVSVPIKYNFPELIVPSEVMRPASVPIQWVFPPLPEITAPVPAPLVRAAPAAAGRIVPPAVAKSEPSRVDRIVPRPAEYPVAPSVGAALTPPASPMTRAEQMAAEQVLYSKTENKETVTVKITTEKGLEARVVNPPKSPNVKLEVSGTV